ncbi:hypothetical protein B723_07800 [Pseudomonas fluorescens NCIMB 11764]|uniref:CdiI immunity protein domain-containing protein n=1 Tax=Pseudomonas fluorescens NCIMB 11764 TaxID=1221522 RepID=A0A0K1QKM0_PSEFL|nr:hypothetical protein [Pseudomonas fluorescens]AKV06301.1 hypothetical protein B723_07800 [Pseudomonas fluorescens NCIMB 11764]
MKDYYNIADIRSLLFVFDIENTDDEEREEIIVSKNVNDEKELSELFDVLIRPEFLVYKEKEREFLISTISYFLDVNDTFDQVFKKMTTYFDDEVIDQRKFMTILLGCLQRYQRDES